MSGLVTQETYLSSITYKCNWTADMYKDCAKCGKSFKIGANEAYNIKIKIRIGGILKIICFCSYANMAAFTKVFH